MMISGGQRLTHGLAQSPGLGFDDLRRLRLDGEPSGETARMEHRDLMIFMAMKCHEHREAI
jgi:hypothetical protein